MAGITFFQIFILIDVFFVGILTAMAIRYGRAHLKARKEEEEKNRPPVDVDEMPPVVRERMLQASQEEFQAVLKHSVDILQHDLDITANQINALVNRSATEIVGNELESYRVKLTQLQHQAETDMSNIKKEIGGHQAEIEAKMTQEIEIEKQRLVKQIDTKIADAVSSFLLETLQHNIDLGSQSSYLLAMLDEHKADIIKEVTDAD